MKSILLQSAGAILILAALIDVFLTVLVARYGTSVFSERIFDASWRLFRAISRLVPGLRQRILIYAGPVALVLMLAGWVGSLAIGFALIYWPLLGHSIRAPMQSETPTDFVSALYISVDCLSTSGNGDFAPVTTGARAITLINSLLGITTITLAVTYLIQIYTR